MGFTIRQAQPEDCATIGRFIRLIAEYEKMSDEVVWDDATLYDQLFVEHQMCIRDRKSSNCCPLNIKI